MMETAINVPMTALAILTLIFVIVFGNPSQIIDYRHRKRYEPGHAWGYYAKLSKEAFSGVPLPFQPRKNAIARDLRGRVSPSRRLNFVFTQPGLEAAGCNGV
jgi:hypothetical protein